MTLIDVAVEQSGRERRRVSAGCPYMYFDYIERDCPKYDNGDEYNCNDCWNREFAVIETDEALDFI